MANELKTTKLVLIGGEPIRLPLRASDPVSATEGDLYWNTTDKTVRVYNGTSWGELSGAVQALDVSYDNAVSGLSATNVQDAIDEVAGNADVLVERVDDLTTLTGLPSNSMDLGTFTGTTIPDNTTIKPALQSLETAVEAAKATADAAIPLAQKGANNGVATLDAGGKIPVAQLPAAVMTYEGVWNASTNTPTLADGTGDAGMVYLVSVAGTQNLGSGPITFEVGDWVVYSGSIWQRSPHSDSVMSVNGQTGIVVLDTDDIAEGATNKYFTEARVRATPLTGGTFTEGVISATDSVLSAFEKLDAEFGLLPGGDVTGPVAATDNGVVRFDGTTGKIIQDSAVTLDDLGVFAGVSKIQFALGAGEIDSTTKTILGFKTIQSVTDDVTIDSASGDVILQGSEDVKVLAAIGQIQQRAALGVARGNISGGLVEEVYFHDLSLAANVSTPTAISGMNFSAASYVGLEIAFSVREASTNATRIGTIRAATDGTTVTSSPMYTETAIVGNDADFEGLKIFVVLSGGDLVVQFQDTKASNACTLKADVKLFKI